MDYDIIHFESLGAEARHLEAQIDLAKKRDLLPGNIRCLIIPDTIQSYLAQNPGETLPDLITIKTHSVPPSSWLATGRRSIITRSAGYDHVEELSAIANIASLRNYCVNAVAQTAMKLLYAAAGLMNEYTANSAVFERNKVSSFMELTEDRVVTVFGAGKIGRRIYELAKANGMNVHAVDIREKELRVRYGSSIVFTTKEEAIRTSDIIINAMSLTRIKGSPFYNKDYFSLEYLKQAKPGLIFINVTRGEIAPENVLLQLYREHILGGIGLDVFSEEHSLSEALRNGIISADERITAAILLLWMAESRTGNVYTQPHQGFNSDLAANAKAAETVAQIIAWYKNKKQHFDEQMPYYR